MTKKIYLETLKSVLGRSILHYCSQRTLLRNKKVKQESFHAHFAGGLHHGESKRKVRLIDQGVNVDDLKRGKSYWQHELEAFQPYGLYEREAALFNSALFHILLSIMSAGKPTISIPI